MLPLATATVTSSAAGAVTSSSRSSATGSTITLGPALAPYLLTLRPELVLRAPADLELTVADAASGVERAEAAPLNASEINAATTAARGEATSVANPALLVAEGVDAREDGVVPAADAPQVIDEAVYEEIGLQDLEFDALDQQFVYPCPCGDLFELSLGDLRAAVAAATERQGFAIASCPSCSLRVKVFFDPERLEHMEKELSLSLMPGGA